MSLDLLESVQVQPGLKIAVVEINSKKAIFTVGMDDNSLTSTKNSHGLSGTAGSANVTFSIFADAQAKAVEAGKTVALTRADLEAFKTHFNSDKGKSFTVTFYKADPAHNGELAEAGSISAVESGVFVQASVFDNVVYGFTVNLFGAEVKNGTDVSYLRPAANVGYAF